jgi:hypothetical protein
MAGQQQIIYDNYVKQVTARNVEPIVSEAGVWPENLEGEEWTDRSRGKDAMSNQWGDREYGPVSVRTSNLGRVMEVQSIQRGMSFVVAVHRTREDYRNYRRPMGMFHYLST